MTEIKRDYEEEWQADFTEKIATKYEKRIAEIEAHEQARIERIFKEIEKHITQLDGKEVVILGNYEIYKIDYVEFARAIWFDWWQALKKEWGIK